MVLNGMVLDGMIFEGVVLGGMVLDCIVLDPVEKGRRDGMGLDYIRCDGDGTRWECKDNGSNQSSLSTICFRTKPSQNVLIATPNFAPPPSQSLTYTSDAANTWDASERNLPRRRRDQRLRLVRKGRIW